jgi:uncharacterized Zn finger protein
MKQTYNYAGECGGCDAEKRLKVTEGVERSREAWVRCADCGRITRLTDPPMDEAPWADE